MEILQKPFKCLVKYGSDIFNISRNHPYQRLNHDPDHSAESIKETLLRCAIFRTSDKDSFAT